MARVVWDNTGEKLWETGVDRGMLYPLGDLDYENGVAWNGLVSVTEQPSGADITPQYADNIKYAILTGAEDYGMTVEAFTYPTKFAECDGSREVTPGVVIGQQTRKSFGMSYRTRIGNDVAGDAFGYKLHLIWGARAKPSERAYKTISDSPELATFSWELSCSPTNVKDHQPTAFMTIDSTKVNKLDLEKLEDMLYGSAATTTPNAPFLPTPDEVIALFKVSP